MEQFVQESRSWIISGVLVLLLVWESIWPFFGFFRQRQGRRLVHGLKNLLFQLANAVVVALVFVSVWKWAAGQEMGLIHWLNLSPAPAAVLAVLGFDFWTYWWHRMSHVVPFLWKFHRLHHSDPEMDVTTANRFHPGEIIVSSILRVPVILLLGAEFWHIALYELLMFPIVQFQHANLHLSGRVDRALSWLITSPTMHKIHHSRFVKETNSNYTSLLSVWDRLFGSFRWRNDPEKLQLGLDEFRDQRLGALWLQPFTEGEAKSPPDSEPASKE